MLISRFTFYAILPNESDAIYRWEINATEDLLPPTDRVKPAVVDRTLAQLNAFQDDYPEAKMYFLAFISPWACSANAVVCWYV